jgi:hypothetical protein
VDRIRLSSFVVARNLDDDSWTAAGNQESQTAIPRPAAFHVLEKARNVRVGFTAQMTPECEVRDGCHGGCPFLVGISDLENRYSYRGPVCSTDSCRRPVGFEQAGRVHAAGGKESFVERPRRESYLRGMSLQRKRKREEAAAGNELGNPIGGCIFKSSFAGASAARLSPRGSHVVEGPRRATWPSVVDGFDGGRPRFHRLSGHL